MLMAYPGARIYEFDDHGAHPVLFDEVSLVGLWRAFLESPDRYFRHLFDESADNHHRLIATPSGSSVRFRLRCRRGVSGTVVRMPALMTKTGRAGWSGRTCTSCGNWVLLGAVELPCVG